MVEAVVPSVLRFAAWAPAGGVRVGPKARSAGPRGEKRRAGGAGALSHARRGLPPGIVQTLLGRT